MPHFTPTKSFSTCQHNCIACSSVQLVFTKASNVVNIPNSRDAEELNPLLAGNVDDIHIFAPFNVGYRLLNALTIPRT